MGRSDHRLSVQDAVLVPLEIVRARTVEPFQLQRMRPREHTDTVHEALKRSAELPVLIGWIVIVRRDRNRDPRALGS